MRAPGKSAKTSASMARPSLPSDPRHTPPSRSGSRRIGFPAPRAVLDRRCAPRLRLLFLRQRSDAHLLAHRGDFRPLGARSRRLRLRFGLAFLLRRGLLRFLLLALRAAAQAPRSIEIAGGGSGGTHGVSFLLVIAASRPLFFRATSSKRRPRDRCARAGAGQASGAARRPADRRARARRSPGRARSIRDRPAPR